MEYTVGRVLKFQIPDSENKYVLVVINDGMIEYYTGFNNISCLDFSFGQKYNGMTDEEIAIHVSELYEIDYFRWALYLTDGTRVDEEIMDRYVKENSDFKVKFDNWFIANYDINDFIQ